MNKLTHTFLLIAAWELVFLLVGNKMLWPEFFSVIKTFYEMLGNHLFLQAILGTLGRLFIAVFLIVLVSSFLIFVGCAFNCIRKFIETCCAIFGPIPAFTWLPIFLVLFGLKTITLYLLCIFAGIWFIVISIYGQIDISKKLWKEQITNLRLSTTQSILLVYAPSLLPALVSTLKTAWNHAWRIIFALEIAFGVLGGGKGLGVLMSDYRGKFEVNELYAILLFVMLVGLLINSLLDKLQEKLNYE